MSDIRLAAVLLYLPLLPCRSFLFPVLPAISTFQAVEVSGGGGGEGGRGREEERRRRFLLLLLLLLLPAQQLPTPCDRWLLPIGSR